MIKKNDGKKGFFDLISAWSESKKLRKQEKTELVAMIEDLDQKLRIQLNKAVAGIEELAQEKLYFLYIEGDDKELTHIKIQFAAIKKMMRWTAPNILILNRPLIELSEKKIKELEATRKKLKRGAKGQ